MIIKDMFPEYPELARLENRIRHGALTSGRYYRSWGSLMDTMTDTEAGKVWKLIFKFMKMGKITAADVEPLSGFARAFLAMVLSSLEDGVERLAGKSAIKLIADAKAETPEEPKTPAEIMKEETEEQNNEEDGE